jgi:hypothetical protein
VRDTQTSAAGTAHAAPPQPRFDIAHTPLSYAGSWLNVSPVLGEHTRAPDLHLISHRNGMHPVFAMTALGADGRVETTWDAQPDLLSWAAVDATPGRIELCFATPHLIRMRGRQLGLRLGAADEELTPFAGSYAFTDPTGAFVFTSYQTGHRYGVRVRAGVAELVGDQAVGSTPRAVLVPAGQDGWELEVHEYRSGRIPEGDVEHFDEVVARTGEHFSAFAASLTDANAPDPTATFAAYVLWSAIVDPDGFVRRPSILMSKHWMDKVWAWDPCFNALALAAGQPDLAWNQFLAMFDHQDRTGALPDSVTHSEILFNFVKPPVHGWAFALLRKRLSRALTRSEVAVAYDVLSRWTDFWLTHRRAPGSPLCHYEHGNDSGWDNSSVFAEERLLETADLAAFLILQLGAIADLADELGQVDQAQRWRIEATEMRTALLELLWDGSAFRSRAVTSGICRSSSSLLDLVPIVLGDVLPADIRAALVKGIRGHLEVAGLATERSDSPLYEPDGYWRGPVWAPPTVLIENGLRLAEETGLADRVSEHFRHSCRTSGFAENFDALTESGLRDRAYTWTASGYLILGGPRC